MANGHADESDGLEHEHDSRAGERAITGGIRLPHEADALRTTPPPTAPAAGAVSATLGGLTSS